MAQRVSCVFAAVVLAVLSFCGVSRAGSMNGRAGTMPAYYDDELFTVNFKELSEQASESIIAHNQSLNVIYEADDCMPGGEMFVAVIDAIQGDGYNPLWQEVQIVFSNSTFPCQQFTSDEDILDAAEAGLITLEPTDEVYRCSVIGPK